MWVYILIFACSFIISQVAANKLYERNTKSAQTDREKKIMVEYNIVIQVITTLIAMTVTILIYYIKNGDK